MKILPAIIVNKKIEEEVEAEILKFFLKELFNPIFNILKEDLTLLNSTSILREAILSGKIYFQNNVFQGQFSAKISKELRKIGAKFDSFHKVYRIQINEIPPEFQSYIAQANVNLQKRKAHITSFLDSRNIPEEIEKISFTINYKKVLDKIDEKFKFSTKSIINITPSLTNEDKMRIATEYSENLKLYIKDFTEDQILELRELVNENVLEGYRPANLEKIILDRFQISQKKARFLAKQETSLLTAKYRQLRYEDAGFEKYIWRSARDDRVRPDHAELNGKECYWKDAPIENKSTGNKAHPGEAFGCRCLAVPVYEG
jgi:SPP1 gp7 family putative phage head morphogenesis protein